MVQFGKRGLCTCVVTLLGDWFRLELERWGAPRPHGPRALLFVAPLLMRNTPALNAPLSSFNPLSMPLFPCSLLVLADLRDTMPAAMACSKALFSRCAAFLAMPIPIDAGIRAPFFFFAPNCSNAFSSNLARDFLSSPEAPAYK